MDKERIYYSEKVEGDKRNYKWPINMDWQDGFLGISQASDSGTDRVLLSPEQVKALIAFNAKPDKLAKAS